MSSKPVLRLDWCSHAAAKYAVEHWHYSRRMPAGKMVRIGVWENERFIGCVLFGRGANNNIGKAYGLDQTEVCELVRVALGDHVCAVSRIGSIAIRMLRSLAPRLRLLVSYADPAHGHHGGIYQAMGWVYSGVSEGTHQIVLPNGQRMHKRSARAKYGTNDAALLGGVWVYPEQKHKYIYPLDDAMREQIAPLAKPYPKRPRAERIGSDAPGDHPGEGGAVPTSALQDDSRATTAEVA